MTIGTRVLFIVTVLALAGCAPADPAGVAPTDCAAGALPTRMAATLTIGTDEPAYEPWYVDNDPTSGRGFESAVAYAIADELGYPRDKVAWTRVTFNAAIQPGPKTFDIDLTQFSITDDRRKAVDFSAPYYDVRQAVITTTGSPVAGATTIAELRNARIGAQVGTTSLDAITSQIMPTSQPAVFSSNDEAKLALSNGQLDALVVDLPTAFYVTSAELTDGKIIGQLPPGTATPERFGAVLDKGSPLTPCVSAAVDRLRADGTLAALEKQWLASAATAPELR